MNFCLQLISAFQKPTPQKSPRKALHIFRSLAPILRSRCITTSFFWELARRKAPVIQWQKTFAIGSRRLQPFGKPKERKFRICLFGAESALSTTSTKPLSTSFVLGHTGPLTSFAVWQGTTSERRFRSSKSFFVWLFPSWVITRSPFTIPLFSASLTGTHISFETTLPSSPTITIPTSITSWSALFATVTRQQRARTLNTIHL